MIWVAQMSVRQRSVCEYGSHEVTQMPRAALRALTDPTVTDVYTRVLQGRELPTY